MLNYILNFLPEILPINSCDRITEPMVMEDLKQVEEYLNYATQDSAMLASYLYHAAGATLSFKHCKKVVDLGCGPASQLSVLAELNPEIEFIGIDLSETMLTLAEKHIKNRQIKNITLIQDDFSLLSKIENESVDGVFSSVALHHLPTQIDLDFTFKSIQRVLNQNKCLYLTDFALLKSPKTMDFLVSLNKNQPPYFKEDYENSLRASFPLNLFKELVKTHLPWAELNATFPVPFMYVIKTKGRGQEFSNSILQEKIKLLSKDNQKLFRDIYYFFRFGGLKNSLIHRLLP